MQMPGPMELLLILLIVLVIFGGSKLPEIGRGLGSMFREFRKASRDEGDEKRAGEKDAEEKKDERK